MNKIVDVFIALVRSAITGSNEEIDLSDLDFESLFSLAKFHDLAHLVCYGLERRGALPEGDVGRRFKDRYFMAVYRHTKRMIAADELRALFDGAKIPYIFLKGAVIMDLYPEPWMRTSSDLDVLVKNGDYENACLTLKNAGWTVTADGFHDLSFNSKDGFHIELHHTLIEESQLPKTVPVLESVWEHTVPSGTGCELFISDELVYFYHIAHMAKHCKMGGCGVRFFSDLWLLDRKAGADRKKREELLAAGGLKPFSETARELSNCWFSPCKPSGDTDAFAEFIINGGVYGTTEQNVAIKKTKAENRLSYYLKRVFPPFGQMSRSHPVLKKCPILLPFTWVVRWFKLLNPKVRRRASKEIKIERSLGKDEGKKIEAIMKRLEIW